MHEGAATYWKMVLGTREEGGAVLYRSTQEQWHSVCWRELGSGCFPWPWQLGVEEVG
jgi:hypothetical protein